MSLGRFGSVAARIRTGARGGEGPDSGGDPSQLLQDAQDAQVNKPSGMPAPSGQLRTPTGGLGVNLVIGGSMESWSAGTSSAPDGWTLAGAGASVSRDTTNVQDGLASAAVAAALNTATSLAQTVPVSATQNTRLRGQYVTLSAQVLANAANRAFLQIDDGVNTANSPYHSGGGAFETLVVSLQLDAAATQLKVSLQLASGAVATVNCDAVVLVQGQTPIAFTPHARDAFLLPRFVLDQSAGRTTASNVASNLSGTDIANVVVDGTQSVLMVGVVIFKHSAAGSTVSATPRRDTTNFGAGGIETADAANTDYTIPINAIDITPAAGTYTYRVAWSTSAATATADTTAVSVIILPSA